MHLLCNILGKSPEKENSQQERTG